MLKYDIVTRRTVGGESFLHALLRDNQVIDNDTLAELLAQRCQQDKALILSVLSQLPTLILERMAQGDIIKLDGLFTLRQHLVLGPPLTEWEDDIDPYDAFSCDTYLMACFDPKLEGDDRLFEVKYTAYHLYPVPVRIEFVDNHSRHEPDATRSLDFGNTDFIDESVLSTLKAAGKLSEHDFMFHWQVGNTLAQPEPNTNYAVMDSTPVLEIHLDKSFGDLPAELAKQLVVSPDVTRMENKVVLSFQSPSQEEMLILLKHFSPSLHSGLWKQGEMKALLKRPLYPLPNLSKADIETHFINIFLLWGHEVMARARTPDSEPALPAWHKQVAFPIIGELDYRYPSN